jgi:hypothetical protein
LKARFDLYEALRPDSGYLAPAVTVTASVSGVITQHTAVVARIDRVIDVCEIVPNHPSAPIHPNLPSQYAAALGAGQIKPFIDGFPQVPSHDLQYHG